MKTGINKYYFIFAGLIVGLFLSSCDKDNFDPPANKLTGRVVYEGENIGVKGSKEEKSDGDKHSSVQLQLWELNRPVEEAMIVSITQDGSYSALLFDGDYRLVAKDGNGPWENRHDTVYFSVKGNHVNIDYPVVPYYTITSVEYTMDEDVLKASFTVNEVAPSDGIESVALIMNKTIFVDSKNQIDQTSIKNSSPGHLELSLNTTSWKESEKALYARVAVKIKNIEECVYGSEIFQVK